MSLKERLDAECRKMPPAIREAWEDLVSHLSVAGALRRVLKVGDRMPDFVLPYAEGQLVTSDALYDRAPLVLTFFRGEWCPYCSLVLDALEGALPDIAAAGGHVVALSPEIGGRALTVKENQRLNFEILCDVDNGVALAFGVAFRVPEAYRLAILREGIDLNERHGNDGWFIPIPASFIVDTAGTIRGVFADPDFTRRAEPDDIIACLKDLRQ